MKKNWSISPYGRRTLNQDNMELFLTSLVLIFAIEGSLFAAFPELMRKCLEEGGRTPAFLLRKIGIICLLVSVILAFLLKAKV